MKNMLFISGSPREGNTDYVLRQVIEAMGGSSELILLRDMDIKHCTGCLACDGTGECPIEDGMQVLYKKMEQAEIIVIGTPNYFDNVPGLMKDMIDRCNTFYNSMKLKGRPVVFIVVGGGSSGDSGRVVSQSLAYFANGLNLDVAASYVFSGTDKAALNNEEGTRQRISEIAEKLRSI